MTTRTASKKSENSLWFVAAGLLGLALVVSMAAGPRR